MADPRTTDLATAMRDLGKRALFSIAENAFKACSRPGCKAHSLGAPCAECSRWVCNSHGYLTMAMPPEVVCEACIAAGVDEAEEPASKRAKEAP